MSLPIEQLLMPRYMVIADYPEIERHNIKKGDIITRSESAMYADTLQDGTPVVAIDHDIFPANFRKLAWYEKRDKSDYTKYIKYYDYDGLRVIPSDKLQKNLDKEEQDIGFDDYWFGSTHISCFQPATEQEYISHINKTK